MEECNWGVKVKSKAPACSYPILTKRMGALSMILLNIVSTMTRMNTVVIPM